MGSGRWLLPAALMMGSGAVAAPPAARTAVTAQPAAAGIEQAVDRAAAKLLADRALTGMGVGVARDGKIVLLKGYGAANLEDREPVTAQTVFRIGSISKEFAAASILLLAERGRLSVDDRLSKYLPDFPRGDEVTLRELLNHTSGIHNYTAVPDFMPVMGVRDLTTAEMIRYIAQQTPTFDFAPDTGWNYSNSGFFLLGAVVEKVSGMPYAQFLQDNILAPQGLRDTAIDDLAQIVPARARGYDKQAAAPTGFVNAGFISMSVAAAAGAVRSTPGDLLRWHAALLGGKVLKPESLAMMLKPGRLKDGRLASAARMGAGDKPATADYGFGISVGEQNGRRTIGHGGAINGFNSSLTTYPDAKLTVVVLTNTSGAAATAAPAVAEAVFSAIKP